MSCCGRNKNLLRKTANIIGGFAAMAAGVNNELAEKRMSICNGCTYLRGGTVCGICGCVIQAKTRLNGEVCPHPDGPKW